MDVEGHFVGGFLFLALHLGGFCVFFAFSVFAQAGHIAFGGEHLGLALVDPLLALLEDPALEFNGVKNFLHEVAVVVQHGCVYAGAAAQLPALFGFLGVGFQLLHLLVGHVPFALLLAKGEECVFAPLFSDFDNLVKCFQVAHAALSL